MPAERPKLNTLLTPCPAMALTFSRNAASAWRLITMAATSWALTSRFSLRFRMTVTVGISSTAMTPVLVSKNASAPDRPGSMPRIIMLAP